MMPIRQVFCMQKKCPECGASNHFTESKCIDCGFIFNQPVNIKKMAKQIKSEVVHNEVKPLTEKEKNFIDVNTNETIDNRPIRKRKFLRTKYNHQRRLENIQLVINSIFFMIILITLSNGIIFYIDSPDLIGLMILGYTIIASLIVFAIYFVIFTFLDSYRVVVKAAELYLKNEKEKNNHKS